MNNSSIFSLENILSILIRKRKKLLIVFIISLIFSIIISSPLFITPLYKSSAVIYPANIFNYSEESNTEQMFQVLLSNDIKFKMDSAFNLGERYKLSKNDPHYITNFINEYNDHVKIKKTDFEAIEIIVYDKDPVVAYKMVTEIINFYNKHIRDIHRKKHLEILEISENAIHNYKCELDTLQQKITFLQANKRVFLNDMYIREITQLAYRGNDDAKEILNNILNYRTNFILLDSLFTLKLNELIYYLKIRDFSIIEANKNITYAHIISRPFIPDKKAYPKRTYIILVIVILSLFLYVFIDITKENILNKIKKIIYNKNND